MAEARSYQCPVCGAFAREGDRSCRHCSSLLATVRCPHCYELSFPGDLHCRGCGQELGLTPESRPSRQLCPDCGVALSAFASPGGTLLACERCGGQMVAHALLRALVEEREVLGRAAPMASDVPRGNPLTTPVRYRPCPACTELMNRKNFGGTSGIVVDVCAKHGTYFDAGELPRVLEFVRRGGLAQARAVLAHAEPPRASSGLLEPPVSYRGSMLTDLADLVSFVVDVLRGD